MRKSGIGFLGSLSLVCACLFGGVAGAWSTDIEKVDNSNDLNDPASWNGGVPPGSTDRGVWDATVPDPNTSPLGGSMDWEGMVVTNCGGPVSVLNTGGAVLTLGDQGIDMSAATMGVTMAAALELGATQTWTIAAGQNLNVQNIVSGTTPLTKSGAGTLTINGDNVAIGGVAVTAGTLRVLDGGMVTDGLQLWLDASDAATISQNGGLVSTWSDKSGNGNDATQGGSQPTYAINPNLPATAAGQGRVVRFDGASTFLNVNLGFLSGTPYTIIVLEIAKSKGGNYSFFLGNQSTGNNNNQALHTGYRTAGDFSFAQWGNDLDYTPANGFNYPQPRLWTDKLDTGSGHYLYLNGTQVNADGDATTLGGPTLGQGYVGSGFDTTTTCYSGDLAEVLVYNRALSDDERSAVENYLLAKWLDAGAGAVALGSPTISVGGGAVLDVSSAPAFSLNAGQDLGGSGTVAGSVSVAGDPTATIHPGGAGGAGTLTLSSNLVFNGAATVTFDLTAATSVGGGVNDLIVVNGALTPNAQAGIVVNSASLLDGLYTLFQYNGTAGGNTFNSTVTFTGGGPPVASATLSYNETVTPYVVQLTVVPAVPRLGFTTPPADANAGAALAPVVVQIVDQNGNSIASNNVPVTLSLDGGAGVLGGTLTLRTGPNGTVTFNNLSITNAGSHTLTAAASGSGTGLAPVTSTIFTITPGLPVSLIVLTPPPAAALAGVALTPPPAAELVDQFGNACASAAVITISANGASLQGTTSVAATGGVAVFTNVYFASLGSRIALDFSGGGLTSTPSGAVNVSAGPVAGLAWATQPGAATSGYPFGRQPVLKTVDQFGNPTTAGLAATQNVAVALSAGAGPLAGTITYNIGTAGDDGVVDFTDLEIDTAGAGCQLLAFAGNGAVPTNFSNCQLWLDGADTNSLGLFYDTVSQWNDKSGNNRNAGQGSASQQPLWATNSLLIGSLGGGSVLHFDSAQNESLGLDLSFLSGSDYTILAVEVASWKNGSNYFIGNDTTGNNNNQALHIGYETPDDLRFGHWGNDIDYEPDAGFVYPQPRVWSFLLNSGSGRALYLNGNQMGVSANTTQLGGPTLSQGHIGAGFDAYGTCFQGDIAEVIMFNRALSDTERSTLEGYLTDKWLTALAPVVSQPFSVAGGGSGPPAQNIISATVNPDGSVTILYSVTGGFPYHLDYTADLGANPVLWTPVSGSTTTPAANGTVSFTDTGAAGAQRFYRTSSP